MFCNDIDGNVKKGGGLLTYVRNSINFNVLVEIGKNISCKDCELQRLELCSNVQKNGEC